MRVCRTVLASALIFLVGTAEVLGACGGDPNADLVDTQVQKSPGVTTIEKTCQCRPGFSAAEKGCVKIDPACVARKGRRLVLDIAVCHQHFGEAYPTCLQKAGVSTAVLACISHALPAAIDPSEVSLAIGVASCASEGLMVSADAWSACKDVTSGCIAEALKRHHDEIRQRCEK